jgi:hypothetical protein
MLSFLGTSSMPLCSSRLHRCLHDWAGVLQDCIALAGSLREGPAFPSPEQLRRTLELLSWAQQPSAASAARLAETVASGRFPLYRLLSAIRYRVLLGCSSSLRTLSLLPWEVKPWRAAKYIYCILAICRCPQGVLYKVLECLESLIVHTVCLLCLSFHASNKQCCVR